MLSTDNPTKAYANAYMQLAMLQSHACGDSTRCDGYDLAIEIIAARRKELDGELKKVKKQIREIEEKGVRWRG